MALEARILEYEHRRMIVDRECFFGFKLVYPAWQVVGRQDFVREFDAGNGWTITCKLNALVGAVPRNAQEKQAYVPFDVTITGEEAAQLVLRYADAINGDAKVFVGFCLDGARIHPYARTGAHEGETGYAIQSNLTALSFVNVNGERVFTASKGDSGPADLPNDPGDGVPPDSSTEAASSASAAA